MKRAGLEDEELLGTADIQSLADLGNSYGIVGEMRALPVKWNDVTCAWRQRLRRRLRRCC